MGAGCARCGECCERFSLKASYEEIMADVAQAPPPGYAERAPEREALWRKRDERLAGLKDVVFKQAHWHPILENGQQASVVAANGETRYGFTCDAWDNQTKLCSAHETRPQTCRGFPWYGGEPNPSTAEIRLRGHCSYWHDIPRHHWREGTDPLLSPDPEQSNG